MSARSPILIAGAAGLLGTAIADALVERGGRLVLADLHTEPLEALAQRLGADAVPLAEALDFRDEERVLRFVSSATSAVGHLAACVNAVGIEGPIVPTDQLDLDTVRDVYETNVFAAVSLVKAIVPGMRTRGEGRIINIASGAGLSGGEFMSAYHSSKHAMVGLTRSMARELAALGISVNAVCPGCIESPMLERIELALSELSDRWLASWRRSASASTPSALAASSRRCSSASNSRCRS